MRNIFGVAMLVNGTANDVRLGYLPERFTDGVHEVRTHEGEPVGLFYCTAYEFLPINGVNNRVRDVSIHPERIIRLWLTL